MGHESWHEPYEELTQETKDLHRAIVSLMEELEAIDWYQQRVDVAGDDDLGAVLAHNRDEEIEHAVMTLEWIRRRVPKFDENLRTYLFSEGPITEVEEKMKEGGGSSSGDEGSGDSESGKKKSGGDKPERPGGKSEKSGGKPDGGKPDKGDGSLGIGSLDKTKKGT